MPREISGFTTQGINEYTRIMAQLLRAGKTPKECYEAATQLHGMSEGSIRNKISVKDIRKMAARIDREQKKFNRHNSTFSSSAA